MRLRHALVATLKSRRFWLWEIAGVIIYAIPAAIRFATGNVVIPFLNFPGDWIWHIIPGNLSEKVLVNAFFPGGAGGVAGEVFFNQYRGGEVTRLGKYKRRLAGALTQTALWSALQFFGYYLLINGPWGGNIFESVFVVPINFVLATLSIFTPDVVGFVKSKLLRH
jgi:hypothetical protein